MRSEKMLQLGYGGFIGGKGSGIDANDMPPKSPGAYRHREDFGSMGSRKFSRFTFTVSLFNQFNHLCINFFIILTIPFECKKNI